MAPPTSFSTKHYLQDIRAELAKLTASGDTSSLHLLVANVVDEIRGNEESIVFDRKCSVVVELLIGATDLRNIGFVTHWLTALHGCYAQALSHWNASHVVESLLLRAAKLMHFWQERQAAAAAEQRAGGARIKDTKASGDDGDSDDDDDELDDATIAQNIELLQSALVGVCQELVQPETIDVMLSDTYGSHVLRSIVCVLNGVIPTKEVKKTRKRKKRKKAHGGGGGDYGGFGGAGDDEEAVVNIKDPLEVAAAAARAKAITRAHARNMQNKGGANADVEALNPPTAGGATASTNPMGAAKSHAANVLFLAPRTFSAVLADIVGIIVEMSSKRLFRVCESPQGAATLQVLLQNTASLGRGTADKLAYRIIDEKAPGNVGGGDGGGGGGISLEADTSHVRSFERFAKHPLASHVMQAIVASQPPNSALSVRLFTSVYMDLRRYCMHSSANFIVQEVVRRIADEGQMRVLLARLDELFDELMAHANRRGIIVALVDGCVRFGALQRDVVKRIVKSLDCSDSRVAEMLLFETENNITVGVSPSGCRLATVLLRDYAKDAVAVLVASVCELDSDTCVVLARHADGSRVLETLLDANFTDAKKKQHFMKTCLLGRLGELAMDKFGSRVVERVFNRASLALKEEVVAELTDKYTILDANFYGRFVLRRCRVQSFKDKPEVWKDAEAGNASKRGVFADFFSEVDDTLRTMSSHGGGGGGGGAVPQVVGEAEIVRPQKRFSLFDADSDDGGEANGATSAEESEESEDSEAERKRRKAERKRKRRAEKAAAAAAAAAADGDTATSSGKKRKRSKDAGETKAERKERRRAEKKQRKAVAAANNGSTK